jgi:peptidoglycan/LPS O-acetylase OafA/YrhL
MFLGDYFIGFIFWLTGVIIAWQLPLRKKKDFHFLRFAFLVMCYTHLAPGAIILKGLNLDSPFGDTIGSHGLGLKTIIYLPICILVIASFAKREILYKNALIILVYIIPLVLFVYLGTTGRFFADTRWIMSAILYLLSITTFFETKFSTLILHQLSYLGSISYSIYLLHWPLALIIRKYLPISGNTEAFILKLLLWIVVTFALSYYLEKYFQPMIKKYFFKNNKTIIPVLSSAEKVW